MMMRGSIGVIRVLLLAVAVASATVLPVAYGQTPSQCNQERRLIVNSCRPVILGINPSAACCGFVRSARVECVCPYVTSKLTSLLNIPRVIKQIEGCGRPVPRNFKCGSITTPP